MPDEAGSQDIVEETRTYRYKADERTPTRAAWAILLLLRSGVFFPLIYGLLAGIVLVEAWLGEWYLVFLLTGVMLFLSLFIWWTMRRQCEGVVQAWQPLETVFGPETLVIRTTIGTAELPLSSIRTVREVGGFVAVRQDHVKLYNLLPREAFPREEIEVVRGLIAARP